MRLRNVYIEMINNFDICTVERHIRFVWLHSLSRCGATLHSFVNEFLMNLNECFVVS